MNALKAQVRNGRLVMDEPTELPEGVEVRVIVVDSVDFTQDDKAAMDAELRRRIARAEAGQTVAAEDVITRLRARV